MTAARTYDGHQLILRGARATYEDQLIAPGNVLPPHRAGRPFRRGARLAARITETVIARIGG